MAALFIKNKLRETTMAAPQQILHLCCLRHDQEDIHIISYTAAGAFPAAGSQLCL